MKKSRFWIIGIAALSMFVYTCKVTQYPVKRDADGRILVDPHPSGAFLSPEESIKHIYPQKGYHLQLVASEPMISQPVSIVWDADGRMYVAEFITYMLDVNGTGEQKQICKIMRLEDTNGDGVMDKATVFIDSLVCPG